MKPGDLKKRLRWFDRGAAAFSQVFPNALGPNAPPHYACPECVDDVDLKFGVNLFPRTAVERRELTAEHVPPRAFEGRELVLTCGCNSRAGHELEGDARKRENPRDVLRGDVTKPSYVRVSTDGYSLKANLKVKEGMLELHAKNPKVWPGFKESMIRGTADRPLITIEFGSDKYRPSRANVAWLRHAYLVLFAVCGYRYIFQPCLVNVRKQIKEPDVEHLPIFLTVVPGEHPWSERCIIKVREPEHLQSWAVQIGRYVVFLPKPGDISFYARLAEDASTVNQRNFNGEVFEWPTEPSFGLNRVLAMNQNSTDGE